MSRIVFAAAGDRDTSMPLQCRSEGTVLTEFAGHKYKSNEY